MANILLSAFADEYSSDIDIQIKMIKEHHTQGHGIIKRVLKPIWRC